MNKPIPWNINGVGFDAREAAREAARRQGKSLGEWLHGVIADHADSASIDERDMSGQRRIDAVTSKLERLSARTPSSDRRETARVDDLAQWRADRDEAARDDERRSAPRRQRDLPAFDAEAVLDEAVEVMERRARRAERQTEDALRSFSKMLERNEAQRDRERDSVSALADKLASIESRLTDRFGGDDNPIKGALARLESRLDTIGRRSAAEAAAIRSGASAKPTAPPERLDLLEDKLNSILAAVHSRPSSEASPMAIAASVAAGASKTRRLGDAIADISARQRSLDPDQGPLSLRQAIGRRRDAVVSGHETRADPSTGFAAMQSEIATLASKIEHLHRDVAAQRAPWHRPSPDLDGLHGEIATMTKTLRDLAPRADVSGIEASMRELGARLGPSRDRGWSDHALRPVENVVGDLHRSLAGLDPRKTIGTLEQELRVLDGKIGDLGEANVAPAAIARIHDQMQEIRDLILATSAKPLAVERIEAQIASLTERVEQQNRHPAAAADLDAAADDLRVLIANPPGISAFSTIETRLEELAGKIDSAVGGSTASRLTNARSGGAEALESLGPRPERQDGCRARARCRRPGLPRAAGPDRPPVGTLRADRHGVGQARIARTLDA